MFTLVAFSQSMNAGGSLTKVNGVPDQHIKVSGKQITVGKLNQIVGAMACVGITATEARIVSPSLRRTNPFYISPIERGFVPSAEPRAVFHPDNPIVLDVNESLEVEQNGSPATDDRVTIGVILADGALSMVTGQIITVNCNVTLALLEGEWSFAEIVFPDSLPVADYAVLGARVIVPNGTLFRFVPVGEAHRPGGVVSQQPNDNTVWEQRFGRMGEWFRFNTVQPPGIEILGVGAVASATYECYIDVIKS